MNFKVKLIFLIKPLLAYTKLRSDPKRAKTTQNDPKQTKASQKDQKQPKIRQNDTK